MRVRLRITLLFVTLVFVILAVVCGSIYFFSYRERLHTITLRLQNRAITTARLFSRREMFDASRLRQIDSLTSVSLRGKIVEVYDSTDHRIYSYSDLPKDSLAIPADVIDKARSETSYYFRLGDREAVAYSYTGGGNHIVVISSANDQQGKQNLLHLRNILMLSLFWGIIVTLLTGYLFSGRLLKPI